MQAKHFLGVTALVAISATNAGQVRADEKSEIKTEVTASKAPFVEGHKFVEPRNSFPRPNTRESQKTMDILTTSAAIERGATPEVKTGLPQSDTPRERGWDINASFNTKDNYRGLGSIFQYTNDGTPNKNVACGQAAIATILTHYGLKPRDTGYTVINDVYNRYGPDNFFGTLGTSWQQMERALRGYGVPFNWYSGESGLRNALSQYKPCIIMLDVGAIPEEGWGWGGHWVVAYGYDRKHIYLTNWNGNDGGKCTWEAFNKAWMGHLAQVNGTVVKFICPKG